MKKPVKYTQDSKPSTAKEGKPVRVTKPFVLVADKSGVLHRIWK